MFRLITPNELKTLINKRPCQIIDIREEDEYNNGHLPTAVNIKDFFYYLSESDENGLKAMRDSFQDVLNNAGIINDLPIVFYEEEMDKKYGGSCRGAFIMTYLGHKEVYVLHGGYASWFNAGFEIENKENKLNPSNYLISVNPKYFADYLEMKNAIGNKDIYILDNRDKVEWLGKSSSPYGVDFSPRKGRIPGAHWLEWYQFMEDINGIPMFKPDHIIRELANKSGMEISDNIIIYCFKGSRASNTLLALYNAGFTNVKVYFASWFEWAKNNELPTDSSVLE